jgi:hypothetical protein
MSGDPGLLARAMALARALRQQTPGAAQAGAEAISKQLPAALMPRAAIEEDRRRKAAMDQMLMDANR